MRARKDLERRRRSLSFAQESSIRPQLRIIQEAECMNQMQRHVLVTGARNYSQDVVHCLVTFDRSSCVRRGCGRVSDQDRDTYSFA